MSYLQPDDLKRKQTHPTLVIGAWSRACDMAKAIEEKGDSVSDTFLYDVSSRLMRRLEESCEERKPAPMLDMPLEPITLIIHDEDEPGVPLNLDECEIREPMSWGEVCYRMIFILTSALIVIILFA